MNAPHIFRSLAALACAVALIGVAPLLSGCHDKSQDSAEGGGAKGKKKKKKNAKKGKGKKGKGGDKGPKPVAAAAPPPVAKKDAPAAPDLPALEAQAKAEAVKAAAPESACGDSVMRDRPVPLDCASDAKITGAVAPLVAFATLKPDDATLPAVVDHRGREGAVRDQGGAPLGAALAIAGAVDHAIANWTGTPGKVSAMHAWARVHEPSVAKALTANVAGLADEDAWPFVADDATAWLATCGKWAGKVKCGQAVDAEKLKAADGKPATGALWIEDVGAFDAAVFRAKLAAGEDIVTELKLGPGFKPVGAEGARYVPNYEGGKGTHAVLITGYARLAHGTYFLLKNSAGEAWGDKGYAWIHEATLKANVTRAYVVDARPADPSKLKPLARRDTAEVCKRGSLPDVVTGKCAGVCPDKSPRSNNVCATTADCPKGHVNLTGECVPAAPSVRSDDKATDLRFFCGPGGCYYHAAKGTAGCEKEGCNVTCPAPTFRAVSRGKDSFACWQ